jgi:hypothetical protein
MRPADPNVSPDKALTALLSHLHPVATETVARGERANPGTTDIVATANSDGFVEIPLQGQGAGPWSFWRWTLE